MMGYCSSKRFLKAFIQAERDHIVVATKPLDSK
jgi:hypothetical protein